MRNTKLFFVGIFLLILFGVVVFLFPSKNHRLPVSPGLSPYNRTNPTLPERSLTPAFPSSYLGWETYIDPQNRYKVKFPPGWDHVIIGESLHLGPKSVINGVKSELAKKYPEVTIPSGITITDHADPIDTSTNNYQKTVTKPITVSNLSATEYDITYLQDLGFAKAGDTETLVMVKHATTWVLTPKDADSKKIFNKLLSTFIFTTPY